MKTGTLSLIHDPHSAPGEDDFSRVLQRLLSQIGSWVKSQKARVAEGYLVPEPDGLMLYLIAKADAYDFELGGELSDFSVSLVDQGLNLNTTLLPAGSPEELAAFFDPLRGPAIRIPAE